ncbi:putative oxidoreductase YdgJ [Aquisphaera giovannonii]|uniref:Putative oxidoreductase YdgJ n=1 Tax=Aquisphaera giovannonii TaxID=406548 RepID=A0A5B9VWT1_9BACT|nr:Gfo/Idh/MocA family oxidoreductase [Aquisphaera giovannonii]QEH32407.1 putative oxidoreductase YdgJ [Aquisphaera giovannonii]
MPDRIKYGIVGVKGVGSLHVKAIEALGRAELTAVADVDAAAGQAVALASGCKFFEDPREMFRSGGLDAASICTPHPSHADLSIDALACGLHVLVEKPIAASVLEADRMAAAARAAGRKLGVVFQRRWDALVVRALGLMQAHRLGDVLRVSLTATALRTMAYYRAASWRGTWAGEGGGAVLNQGSHDLDLYQLLAGMPRSLFARCETRLHAIEVEDSAAAVAVHPDGSLGTIQINTIEAPGRFSLEIAGDRGTLLLDRDRLTLFEHGTPVREFARTSKDWWSSPESIATHHERPADGTGDGTHLRAISAFVDAILADGPPPVDAEQAIRSLELSNAMRLSSALGRPVTLPLDREAYRTFLERESAR